MSLHEPTYLTFDSICVLLTLEIFLLTFNLLEDNNGNKFNGSGYDDANDGDYNYDITDHLPSLVQYFVANLSSENFSCGKAETMEGFKNIKVFVSCYTFMNYPDQSTQSIVNTHAAQHS